LISHPDKGGTDAEFQMVNEAWGVLGDPTKRNGYDRVSTFIPRTKRLIGVVKDL